MRSIRVLAALAQELNREAGAPAIPSLYFLTDPIRTPDPVQSAARLPRGSAVIYRHFGAADRRSVARALARICHARGLPLLISADPSLAREVGANGVHWPERLIGKAERFGLTTAAAHGLQGLAAARQAGLDACLLAPIFPTDSASGNNPLGLFHASQLARASGMNVIALGGINASNAARLRGRGFAGIAAVDALR
jgi:thiamine-phosphate pyrophosphorylase